MRRRILVTLLSLGCASLSAGEVLASSLPTLPPLKRQSSAAAVVAEHLAALNACDWNRLMAQYPSQMTFFLPGGQLVQGRVAVGKLFTGFCKPYSQGGLKGIHFTTEHSQKVGDTINVQWRVEAPFLRKPYRGADAYVTHAGLMYAQVTTFDGKALPYAKSAK